MNFVNGQRGNFYFEFRVEENPKNWMFYLSDMTKDSSEHIVINGKENIQELVNILLDNINKNKYLTQHPKDNFDNYDEYILSELYNNRRY